MHTDHSCQEDDLPSTVITAHMLGGAWGRGYSQAFGPSSKSFCISKYWEQQWLETRLLHLYKDIIIISLQLEAIKTGSGGRPGNEAESVRMLALFQDHVTLLSWSDCNQYHA